MQSSSSHTDLKIFLVDDDIFNLKITRFHLNRLGYKDITTFQNGSACIENLSLNPDIVFLDQYMDGMQGIDVLKKIRELNTDIVVVMLSAEDNEVAAILFKQQGALDYIIKGNDAIDKIDTVLKKISQRVQE